MNKKESKEIPGKKKTGYINIDKIKNFNYVCYIISKYKFLR